MIDTETRLEAAVAAGVEFLEGVRPGWANDIDLDIFDVDSGYRCVVGQLDLRGVMSERGAGWHYPAELGFSPPEDLYRGDLAGEIITAATAKLNEIWVREIKRHKVDA